jgi:hypothetical protein
VSQHSKSQLYSTWGSMIQRCTNPKSSHWHRYGGRGIKVCERWRGRGGFANFLSDVGERPAPGLSIDRIDNDGNYEPGNVRWATAGQQVRNSASAKLNERQAEQMVADFLSGVNTPTLCSKYGFGKNGVYNLLKKAGVWSSPEGIAIRETWKNVCRRGHAWTPEATQMVTRRDGSEKRLCRECRRMSEHKRPYRDRSCILSTRTKEPQR